MKNIYVGAAVIINENRNKILVTKRQGGEFDGLWEFPGGKIEEGEKSSEATVREIKEELSLNIKIIDLFKTINYQYNSFYLTMDLYWSSIESGNMTLNEHSDYLWAAKDDLVELDWVPADIQLIELLKESNFLQ